MSKFKSFPLSLLEELDKSYSEFWWSDEDESLFREAMREPFKNMIFTLLSQNTSAKNTRKAFLGLTSKFKVNPSTLAEVDEKELSEAIKQGGLHHIKARRIKLLAKEIMKKYRGNLAWIQENPKEIARAKILELPGVGDKTADVLLSSIYTLRETIVVDTHMRRIAVRLGLVSPTASYAEVQSALKNFFPWQCIPKNKEERILGLFWILAKHTCKARKPNCTDCMLSKICDKNLINTTEKQ